MAFLLIIYTSLFFYPDFYRSFHHPLHPTDIDYLFSSTIKIAVYAEGGIPSSVNRDNIGDFSEIKRKDNARIRASLRFMRDYI